MDFLMISTRTGKRGVIEIYPKFVIKKSSDLMIRGGDFYAIWVEERGLWSTNEQDALEIIDRELDAYAKESHPSNNFDIRVLHMWDSENGMIDRWHKYCQKHMRDSFVMLDEKLIFSNMETKKEDYVSKKLPYPLAAGPFPAYDKLMSALYSEEERMKIEWAIGAVVSGDSKHIQKFLVLYGAVGAGKSTVLNIIQKLFEGYCEVFNAKDLGSASNAFALEAFRTNPLVAIQHDGDLSRIEDNTRLNSLVSHETMTVNEKFKSAYSTKFKSFLFIGTNKPVKITDGKSGLLRRLIDVSPSGNKLSEREYRRTVKQIDFELGAIAQHCLDVYNEHVDAYANYIPIAMLGASNDFYNFVEDSYYIFKKDDGVSQKAAWEMYKTYCEEARVAYPFPQRVFKEELKNYFEECLPRHTLEDGTRVRNYYIHFLTDKFEKNPVVENSENVSEHWLKFEEVPSAFDTLCGDCPAQYASNEGTPMKRWVNVKTTLSELDTSKLHYVKIPENHIIIDFDIPGEDGEKDFARNFEEACKWPATYAELSKSGAGIHLHYIYSGDVDRLKSVYGKHIEVKVFKGNASLRRMLTKCNALDIATISSGLPLKGDKKKMVNIGSIKSEKSLRNLIERNLNKEIHPATKPSMDFICKILDDAYNSELKYDVSDMRPSLIYFAANSSNKADYCLKLIDKMKFSSEEHSETSAEDERLIFYDIEVFPNLFLVNWKVEGEGKAVVRMINPSSAEIEELIKHRLVGFNCRRYDNHILYARLMGYTNEQVYNLSQKIIKGESRDCFFGEAYNLSYTDVYDFCSKKQSLKKWEIELGIHHQELGLPWDQPVPEEMWEKVAGYCDNDVLATEAVFNARQADFTARKVLADVAGATVNDTTNSLTTKIIFGKNKHPQDRFNYRFLGTRVEDGYLYWDPKYDEYSLFDSDGRPHFPGYEFEAGKSIYRGEEVGEGGYVYAEPGMYGNVALLDIASMHPSSIIAENLFGNEYTARFNEILQARIAIKHKDFDHARKMLGGKLAKYLTDESAAADLAQALKIAVNSVYGLTSAKFDNPFRDQRNVDNIVAKRGALFMVNLKHEIQKRGFIVAHCKTDSVKVPDATPEIIQFIIDYGKMYGYNFEHEATYDRMCLVNDAVYIAKYKDGKHAGEWTATGKQFAVPYIYKKLFSNEEIGFEDLCETKATKTSLYLDMNESLPDVSGYEKEMDKLETKYRKGLLSDTDFEKATDDFDERIAKGHDYHFVGKVGLFCPIKPGKGGGLLVWEKEGKYNAVTGTKGYRWLESEMVKELGKEEDIDLSYYENLVDEARKAIVTYGDFTWFVSNDPYIGPSFEKGEHMDKPCYEEELPWN
ncbi:MAG: DUF5906 domain-containing protein [Lachnospiraceae bacterium]|nr:DUF5906 domain-containing protein [Lachnospiraceae bacterium]